MDVDLHSKFLAVKAFAPDMEGEGSRQYHSDELGPPARLVSQASARVRARRRRATLMFVRQPRAGARAFRYPGKTQLHPESCATKSSKKSCPPEMQGQGCGKACPSPRPPRDP